jgi:hypothetical protein
VSDMMGRMSRLKLTGPFGSAARLSIADRAKLENVRVRLASGERIV